MRRLRWGAAGLAALLMISYCIRMKSRVAVAPPAAASTVASPVPVVGRRGRDDDELRAREAARARAAWTLPTSSTPTTATATAVTATTATMGASSSTLATLLPPTSADWARGKFADFTPEELADMVGRCELRWQLPPFDDDGRSSLGADYDHALMAERDRYVAQLRALYVEQTGDRVLAERMDLRMLADALRRGSGDDATEVHLRLARARAGDEVTPRGSPYERFLQLQLDAGDAFERALAPSLGQARAHELRLASGAKHTITGCEPGGALFRSTRR
jgi:hypothetical protein